ncbi:MAG: hypothetical protein Q8Q09_18845 [Deltaproteobacteria bacterium]|nr:hypothetical protein [Deltaproteobacteria bacterium]
MRHTLATHTTALTLTLASLLAAPDARAQTQPSDPLETLGRTLERDTLDAPTLRALARQAQSLSEQPTRNETSRALAAFYQADACDRALDFACALRAYERVSTLDPGCPFAGRARARALTLAPYAVDHFDGLTRLEALRRSALSQQSPAQITELSRALSQWPASPARPAARLLLARALSDHGALDASLDCLRALLSDPASDPDQRALALHQLTQQQIAAGRAESSVQELRANNASPSEITLASRMARRHTLARASTLTLALYLGWGLLCALRAVRKGHARALAHALSRPLGWVHLSVLTLGGAWLTWQNERHEVSHMLALGAGASLVYLAALSTRVAASPTARAPRVRAMVRALAAVLALVSVAFLALLRFDAGLLDGLSL